MLGEFDSLGVKVVGASVDPVERLRRFREKHGLRFPLISDRDRAIGTAFDTLKSGTSSSHERDTVLIDRDGIIVLAYRKAKAQGHAAQILTATKELKERGAI